MSEENKNKIDELKQTIRDAEQTIQQAKATLLQLGEFGGKSAEDGEIIYGKFDGQIMIDDDGKQYPVPANYASKSKLIEGDMLKLTITDNGAFIYKQVGPIDRKNLIGIASQDENGNYYVMAEGTPYKILLASATYFKINPGDEVVVTVPSAKKSDWAAVENVLQKGAESNFNDAVENNSGSDIANEWASDIEEIKKEIQAEK